MNNSLETFERRPRHVGGGGPPLLGSVGERRNLMLSALHVPYLEPKPDMLIGQTLARTALIVRAANLHDDSQIIDLLEGIQELSFTYRWEAGKIRQALLTGESPIVIAERGNEIVGVGVAGIHGMRGIVHHVAVTEAERANGVGTDIVKVLLAALNARGIRRIHTFVDNSNVDAAKFLNSVGFSVNDGERLLQMDLISAPGKTSREIKAIPGVTQRAGEMGDLDRAFDTLSRIPELAFQPWERSLLEAELRSPSNLIFLLAVSNEGTIEGALIGGHNGIRGTINHLWVSPNHRRDGLGRSLLNQALDQFERVEVKRLHIMLTPGNDVGYKYWSGVGFSEILGETFMEADL